MSQQETVEITEQIFPWCEHPRCERIFNLSSCLFASCSFAVKKITVCLLLLRQTLLKECQTCFMKVRTENLLLLPHSPIIICIL